MFILEGALLTTSCITGHAIVQQNCETSSGADLGGAGGVHPPLRLPAVF